MEIQKLRNTYNKIADAFTARRDAHWNADYIQYLISVLPKGAMVLDLGCGPGIEAAQFAAAGLRVYGLDLSDEFIKIAQQKCPTGTFVQGDMHSLPYENSSFDLVFAQASLLHIPKEEMADVIAEITRALKPGGLLHVALKKGEGEAEVADTRYNEERFFSFWQMDEFQAIVAGFAYEIVKSEEYQRPGGQTTWLKFVFKKL